MISCLNEKLNVELLSDGTYHLFINGVINISHVSPVPTPSSRYYISLERDTLFVLTNEKKMILRGTIPNKECLNDTYILGNWDVFNPPVKKTFFY